MLGLATILAHWGYLPFCLLVCLGNLGVPIPEKSILLVVGYLLWARELSLGVVFGLGVASAVLGGSLGYWLGRRFGRRAVERYGRFFAIDSRRFEMAVRLVNHSGSLGILVARFLPGIRFLVNTLAGLTGFSPVVFLLASLSGTVLYLPIPLGAGYLIGRNLGDDLDGLGAAAGRVGTLALLIVVGLAIGLLCWITLRRRRQTRPIV
jgi:membrane protein DedA with SNARE-associated domain